MADDLVARLLAEQRRRLIATVLGAAEATPGWSKLTPPEQKTHRDKVTAAIGTFYDFCRDVVKVSGEDGMRNEYALTLIQQVHESQQALHRKLVDGG